MVAPRAPRRRRIDGGIGTRGPGETQIETDRRLARDRISALKRKLEHVRSSRSVMRAERERAHLPQVALAGYTNAGKSTLLNALTGADVGVRDRLFHTLDPTTRVLRAGGRDYLLTDTVGFIRKLPHQLVEAFGATLEETRLADLILHVVDALGARGGAAGDDARGRGRAQRDRRRRGPRLLVLGKADLIDERAPRRARQPPPRRRARLGRDRRGPRRADRADRGRVRAVAARRRAADPLRRGRPAGRAARDRRRPATRGHARGRARARAAAGAGRGALRAVRARPADGGDEPAAGPARSTRRATLPTRAYAGDAGLDLYALEPVTLAPGERASVRTGIAVEIPEGQAGLVLPRSGLAARHGIALVNAPGPDRRRLPRRAPGAAAEHRPRPRRSRSRPATGSRSWCWSDVQTPEVVEVDALAQSERGAGGFGSSGGLSPLERPRAF